MGLHGFLRCWEQGAFVRAMTFERVWSAAWAHVTQGGRAFAPGTLVLDERGYIEAELLDLGFQWRDVNWMWSDVRRSLGGGG